MVRISHLNVRRQHVWGFVSQNLRYARYARRAIYSMSKLNEIAESLGQHFTLAMEFMKKIIPLGLTVGQVKNLIEQKDHPFWLAFNEAVKLLAPQPIEVKSEVTADASKRQVDFWVSFYKTHFRIDLDPADINIPNRRDGFNWLVIVAKGVSLNHVWAVCKKHFKCWNYANTGDLESLVWESERGKAETTSVFWFRDCVEADEETRNLSAKQQTEPSITLIVRCLLELKYFSETGKHLDIKNITLCAGSRYADGDVPGADWYRVDGFRVRWCYVDNRDHKLRSRVAVGG